jgi:hypothetical protein
VASHGGDVLSLQGEGRRDRGYVHQNIWWLALALGCAGCGDSELAPVSGTVRLEGVALTGGILQLTPDGGGRGAVGDIQSDGRFTLSTQQLGDGAAPGKYSVAVVPNEEAITSASLAEKLPKGRADSRLVFFAPKDLPVEIAVDRDNVLELDISIAGGWRAVRDD